MDQNTDSRWELFAGKLNQELSPDETETLENQLSGTTSRAEFKRIEKVHASLKHLGPLQKANKTSSWSTIALQIRNRKIKKYTFGLLKYAAILVIAFLAGTYFHSILKSDHQLVQYSEIEVMYGQTGHLFLFDGTEVWLNSGSKLKYPNRFAHNERDVFIQGEAYFKVKPDKHLPFKVKTGNLEVEVLGTSFNVTAYPEDSTQTVVLVEGKVKLNNSEGKNLGDLLPGQIAVKPNNSKNISVQNTDPYFYTSWKEGKVVFNGERLSDIAKKMERWYNVEISFDTENMKDYKFTGTILRNKPIDQTIMAMELLAPIRFIYSVNTDEKNKITIKPKQ